MDFTAPKHLYDDYRSLGNVELLKRADRALLIAYDHFEGARPVEPLPSGEYLVPASDGLGCYRVTPGAAGECTCPDYTSGRADGCCKHLIAVAMIRAAEREPAAARAA